MIIALHRVRGAASRALGPAPLGTTGAVRRRARAHRQGAGRGDASAVRAKTEAAPVGVVLAPLIAMLALVAPFAARVSLAGVVVAAASAMAIQFWFRAQAQRSQFRRRQTSSKIARFAEAIAWNG